LIDHCQRSSFNGAYTFLSLDLCTLLCCVIKSLYIVVCLLLLSCRVAEWRCELSDVFLICCRAAGFASRLDTGADAAVAADSSANESEAGRSVIRRRISTNLCCATSSPGRADGAGCRCQLGHVSVFSGFSCQSLHRSVKRCS